MQVSFNRTKMEKEFRSEKTLRRAYGDRMSREIIKVMAILDETPNLAELQDFKSLRCHQLKHDRDEQFALDLAHPYRLIIKVDNDPVPRLHDGGIDKQKVTKVVIIEVVDYH